MATGMFAVPTSSHRAALVARIGSARTSTLRHTRPRQTNLIAQFLKLSTAVS